MPAIAVSDPSLDRAGVEVEARSASRCLRSRTPWSVKSSLDAKPLQRANSRPGTRASSPQRLRRTRFRIELSWQPKDSQPRRRVLLSGHVLGSGKTLQWTSASSICAKKSSPKIWTQPFRPGAAPPTSGSSTRSLIIVGHPCRRLSSPIWLPAAGYAHLLALPGQRNRDHDHQREQRSQAESLESLEEGHSSTAKTRRNAWYFRVANR